MCWDLVRIPDVDSRHHGEPWLRTLDQLDRVEDLNRAFVIHFPRSLGTSLASSTSAEIHDISAFKDLGELLLRVILEGGNRGCRTIVNDVL